MEKQHLYQPFEVEYKEMNEDPIVEHKHNFFEMVFIMEGTGVQCVNEHKFNYGSDHFMLMFPNDCHAFQVKTTTKFFFIRFNNIYLQSQHREWIQKLEFIFQNHNHLPGCLLKNKSDKILVRAMVDAIIREQVNQQAYHRDLIQQIINTLITVVARNITFAASLPSKKKTNPSMEMVNYINEHIYDPEKLKAEVIARQFNISPSYISEYFKTHNGDSLQQYILNYRLKLVEIRLKHSEKRISEIALEMGFTDESHMNRLFKKYKGASPSEYRKSAQAVA